MDMEQVHDTSIIPDRIRQDVSRSPGGDSRVFLNNCIGCHAGMDPLAQAFAYYNYNETSRPHRIHARRRAAEVLQQRRDVRRRLHHAGRLVEQPLAPGPERADRLELGTARARATARSRSARSSRARTRSRSAKSRRSSKPCACARRAIRPTATQIDAMTSSFTNGYDLKPVFAESAKYCMGN